jgi:hypothetical protein
MQVVQKGVHAEQQLLSHDFDHAMLKNQKKYEQFLEYNEKNFKRIVLENLQLRDENLNLLRENTQQKKKIIELYSGKNSHTNYSPLKVV